MKAVRFIGVNQAKRPNNPFMTVSPDAVGSVSFLHRRRKVTSGAIRIQLRFVWFAGLCGSIVSCLGHRV